MNPGTWASPLQWHHSKCLELPQVPALFTLEVSQRSWDIPQHFPKGSVPPLLQTGCEDFHRSALSLLCVVNQHPLMRDNVFVFLPALLQGLIVFLV